MSLLKQKGLAVATAVYWFFLLYIIAALIWWFIALQRQNNQITAFKLSELSLDDPSYLQKARSIIKTDNSKSAGYVGEGARKHRHQSQERVGVHTIHRAGVGIQYEHETRRQ